MTGEGSDRRRRRFGLSDRPLPRRGGVGTIGLIDADVVDLSNLQRQIIHHTSDIGRPKVLSAQEKMVAINSDVKVVPYQENLDADNALKIFNDFDYVIDGTDNFPAKFLINDAAHFAKKPLIHGDSPI